MTRVPIENALAFYPPARRAGRLDLKPLTLGGAAALAALGVDFARRAVPGERLALVAAVLGGLLAPADALYGAGAAVARALDRALRRAGNAEALSKAVATVLDDAFATRLKPLQEGSAPVCFTPKGLGWPLQLAEALCGDYGWTFEQALATPVASAWALAAAGHARRGGRFGEPDYTERVEAEKIRAEQRREANHG